MAMNPRPSTLNSQPSVYVHIERLVLDGLGIHAGRRSLLQAAVEAELARLLTAGGLNPALLSSGAMPSIRANAMQWSGSSDPVQLGQRIARSVYGGIGAAEQKP